VADVLTVLLCGDVMTGRGVDQILPHPGDPTLREGYLRDARGYVERAESANGPIPSPVDFAWPWGDALRTAANLAPDVRVINLETSITGHDGFAAGKGIHYRMSPDDVPCLTAFGPDVCTLANNHVLDFGRRGLGDTLDVLSEAGIHTAGAGRNLREARELAVVPVEHDARVIVLACGTGSSGIPPAWAATRTRPGVLRLPDLSDDTGAELTDLVNAAKGPGDVGVVSIHWGPNWGYQIAPDQRRFAHRLIDAGIDIVHGHSSHHPRPIEVYHDKLVLYGCGDFINDYEGIHGHEQYRPDLRLMYLASLEAGTGRLLQLRMTPMQARKMRLNHACDADTAWLCASIDRVSRAFATRVELAPDGTLTARPD
jgi:poly-gamma-glutamate capsule biosynthesis protein CapA/YwtB (metallophosphatase superfamily)